MANKRLLIVDDEPKFAALVRKVAEPLGYDVEITTQGRDFMEAYRREPPDTVVLDMVMPEIDGNELILWLVGEQSRSHIIIITGYSPQYATNARLLAEYKGLRSVKTLSKPVSLPRLRQALTDAHGCAPMPVEPGDRD